LTKTEVSAVLKIPKESGERAAGFPAVLFRFLFHLICSVCQSCSPPGRPSTKPDLPNWLYPTETDSILEATAERAKRHAHLCTCRLQHAKGNLLRKQMRNPAYWASSNRFASLQPCHPPTGAATHATVKANCTPSANGNILPADTSNTPIGVANPPRKPTSRPHTVPVALVSLSLDASRDKTYAFAAPPTAPGRSETTIVAKIKNTLAALGLACSLGVPLSSESSPIAMITPHSSRLATIEAFIPSTIPRFSSGFGSIDSMPMTSPQQRTAQPSLPSLCSYLFVRLPPWHPIANHGHSTAGLPYCYLAVLQPVRVVQC
jgi:hypothetical protein